MFLERLNLQNFRNFKKNSFSFSPKVTLVLGPNTSGKTNILEAIYLLSTGQSFRAELEQEMISYGQEVTRVKCQINTNKQINKSISNNQISNEINDLEIILTPGQVAGQLAPHKKYLVNGVGKRMIDFLGNLRAVLFWPEDLDLVTNSPSRRRKYLDFVLSQVDREYRRSLLSYEKGLRQRNKLLERIRDEGASRSQLMFWNQLLIKNGAILTDKRIEFIESINSLKFPGPAGGFEFSLEYDKSVISETRLEQYSQEEVAAGATLVGPHRDDFMFFLSDRDISLFGSRGEQRMAILWLKLAELEFITAKTGDPSTDSTSSPQAGSGQGRPILLLDDIFSELDHEHRRYVLDVIPNQQTIITTTDLHLVEKSYLKDLKTIEL